MIQRPPAEIGQKLEEVDTPALILDLDGFEKNQKTLFDLVKGRVRVRPHAKTHKCPEVAKRQIALGAVGMCCQKVSEAEAMVDGGVHDVLVSNEVVGAPKLARLAELSRRAQARRLRRQRAERRPDQSRRAPMSMSTSRSTLACGAAAWRPARRRWRWRKKSSSTDLRFAGLQAYHGRAQHIRSMEERHAVIETAAQHVQHTKRLLAEAGIACPIVTGAGSGTFMLEVEAGAWDEIQCGSYAFMDVDYAKNEWAAPLPRFEHALFVLSTVMSRPSPEVAIVDAGLKASSVDSGMPGVWQKDLRYTHASDEHGWVEGKNPPALGEKLLLVAGPLRSDDQPVRLVRLHPGRCRSGFVGDHR